jgi:N-acetylglucosamine kinase-like BadF-type ATPase
MLNIVNDSLAALATATGAPGDGVVLVAGTGSIAIGVHGGSAVRVGGWGPLFKDAGSAFDIGLQALERAAAAVDAQKNSRLAEMICERVGVRSLLEVMEWVYAERDEGHARVASLAPVVIRAVQEREPETDAMGVFVYGTRALCRLVSAVMARLGLEREGAAVPIVLAGGLFNEFFLELSMQNQLRSEWPRCKLVRCVLC